MVDPLLRVENLVRRFGGILATDNLSLDVIPGELHAIIGPNGAGKTTLFNCFSRLYTPSAGDILFEGASILSRPPHRIAEIGIGRTFQNLALFRTMTVLDNVRVGSHPLGRTDFFSNALKLPWTAREESELAEIAWELIDFLDLGAVAYRRVADLPFGLQKRVELARALAAEPRLLLLDEPMAGMSVEEKQDMCRFVLDVNDEFGTTIALIEHDMSVVMDISDRVMVLDYGRKIGDGTPAEVRASQAVIDAYLGVKH